jgi:hypothetical protein
MGNKNRRYFHSLFQAPTGCPIQEILQVVSKFQAVITEDMNKALEEEVTEAEVLAALSSMQQGKIPGPDGFTLEFFQGFYDLVKEHLLMIVRESQSLEGTRVFQCHFHLLNTQKAGQECPSRTIVQFLVVMWCIKS